MTGVAPEFPPPLATAPAGAPVDPLLNDERISSRTGEFYDPALEHDFRKARRDEWARRVATVSVAGAILVLGFSYVSYRTLGPGMALVAMSSLRLALLAIGLAIATILARSGSVVALDRAALTFMLSVSVVVFGVVYLEHKGIAFETPATLLAVISFYLFMPTRGSFQLAGGLVLSIGFLGAQALWGPAAPAEWASTAVQLLICNVLGAYTSLRNHALVRREFLALRQARRMAAEETRRKEELQGSVTALERSNAELEQFAYIASHDLQAPLRNVISFAQLLQRRFAEGLGAKGAGYIDTVVQSADHMHQLITDLLALSRVGRSGLSAVRVDTGQVLAQVEYQLNTDIREKRAEITHDPLPTLPGIPMEMLQLFQNLVDNALKFQTPGVPPRIHVSARRSHTLWEFSVRDNGLGVAAQYRDKIFKAFQRLNASPAYKGTGIGLAICQKIVQQHGGRIWLTSEPGRGSTFSFTLPSLFAQAFPPAA